METYVRIGSTMDVGVTWNTLSSAETTELSLLEGSLVPGIWEYIYLIVLVAILLEGATANGLALFVLVYSSELRHETGPPVIGLTVVNILQALSLLPERCVSMLKGGVWLSEALCDMFGWMYVTFKAAALGYTTCIAVDRCLRVVWPLHYQGRVIRNTTHVGSLCVSVYSALLATAVLLGGGDYAYSPAKQLCLPSPSSRGYMLMVLLAGMLVPQILTMMAFLGLSYTAWHTAKKANYVCDANHCTLVTNRKAHRKNIRMTLIHLALFLVFWLPFLAVNLHAYIFHWEPPQMLNSITETLTYGSVALEPFIYAAFYQPFRSKCKQLWKQFCHLNSVHDDSILDTESNHQRKNGVSSSKQGNSRELHEHIPVDEISKMNTTPTGHKETHIGGEHLQCDPEDGNAREVLNT